MNIIIALAILSPIVFGSIAVYFVRRFNNSEKKVLHKNKELSRKIYELLLTQEVSEQIGYSLSVKNIMETVVRVAQKLFDTATISYAVLDQKTIVERTIQRGLVGGKFLEAVKNYTLEPLWETYNPHEYSVIDSVQKDIIVDEREYYDGIPRSHFAVPLVVNGKKVGVVCISSTNEDITEDDETLFTEMVENATSTIGKLAELIDTEEAKLHSFLFSLTSGALLFLLEGEVIRLSAINNAAKQFLHLNTDVDTTAVIAHFGMHYDLVENIKSAIQEKKSMIIKDVKIYERYFKIYLNPVFLSGNQTIIGVSVTMEDITLEKDVEEVRETFTNMVVHELRAPLTSIKGAASMLISGNLKKADSEKMLHIIADSTERMLTDIGDVLDVAKLEAGKFELHSSLNDINSLVKDKALAFSFSAEQQHITILTKIDPNIAQCVFDAPRIGQVLNNLFSNALKYTPENGQIIVSTSLQNNKIQVSVHDNGVGVPPEKMAVLFSKYGQIQNSLRKQGGTGLGLFISKGIISSHGGKIWLDSKPNEGTTVTFELPIVLKPEVVEEVTHASIEKKGIPASSISQRVVN